MEIIIEVCATSIMSAIAAEKGGAKRIELCDNILEGGTTPSAGMIKMATEKLNLDVCVLIRPRGGDFLYNNIEFEQIKQDIIIAKQLNANGVVTGILDKYGLVDMVRMEELISLAQPMRMVFHRAFDMCSDPYKVLNQLIELKVDRLLTSGQKNTAVEGAELICELISIAGGRIEIMPGSGINIGNFHELMQKTGATNFHLTGRSKVSSGMDYQQNLVLLNSINKDADYTWQETDANIIREIVRIGHTK
ncbi:MAG: copper homeostasis protein CutC [Bacteroidetes bacterium]|nr:copper homeostasis protein CutC [Bacteroidota bacterium]